jgi:phenylacetic acid degradation operon negative regulatory protein
VAALVAAGELFGLGESSVRVAVTRLLAAGHLERDERGLYRLGAEAQPVDRQVRAWRRREDDAVRWSGAWIGVHTAGLPRARGRVRSTRERALRLLGFRDLAAGLAVRPDNLRGGVARLRDDLAALGLGAGAVVARLDALDAVSEARARALWDVDAMRAGWARLRARLEASEARLPQLEPGRAMAESFLLGGLAIRHIVRDPLLPEPIAPVAERRALVAAARRYDLAGRRVWSAFMAAHGAPSHQAPADTRLAGPPARVAHAGDLR